jgi:hypothetical protein
MSFVPTGSESSTPLLVRWSAGDSYRDLLYTVRNWNLLDYTETECNKFLQNPGSFRPRRHIPGNWNLKLCSLRKYFSFEGFYTHNKKQLQA